MPPKKANRMPKEANLARFTGDPRTRRQTPANQPFDFSQPLFFKDDPFGPQKKQQKKDADDRASAFGRKRWEDAEQRRDAEAAVHNADLDFRRWKANVGGGTMWKPDAARSRRNLKKTITRADWNAREHVRLWADGWRFGGGNTEAKRRLAEKANKWRNAWGPGQWGNPELGLNRTENRHLLKEPQKVAPRRKNCPIPAHWRNKGPLIQKLWNNWCERQEDLWMERRGRGELTDAQMDEVLKRASDRAKNPSAYDEAETRKIERLVKDLGKEIKEQDRIKGPDDFFYPHEWFEYAEAMAYRAALAERQFHTFSMPARPSAQGVRPRPGSPTGRTVAGAEGRPTTTPNSPKGRRKTCSPSARKKGMCVTMGGRQRKRATRRHTRRHKRKRRISRRRRRRKRRRTRRRR